jgi:hypothetical protein
VIAQLGGFRYLVEPSWALYTEYLSDLVELGVVPVLACMALEESPSVLFRSG